MKPVEAEKNEISAKLLRIAGSSNGRTTASGAVYLGSNPGPAAV